MRAVEDREAAVEFFANVIARALTNDLFNNWGFNFVTPDGLGVVEIHDCLDSVFLKHRIADSSFPIRLKVCVSAALGGVQVC